MIVAASSCLVSLVARVSATRLVGHASVLAVCQSRFSVCSVVVDGHCAMIHEPLSQQAGALTQSSQLIGDDLARSPRSQLHRQACNDYSVYTRAGGIFLSSLKFEN